MNIPVSQAADGLPRRAFTVADILRMVETGILNEGERFELIKGEIVPMSPKGNQHEVIKLALTRVFAKQAPDELRIGIETTVYLSEDTFLEPDLCVYPKRLLPEDVRGKDILLAIEVAGSSLGYDSGLKAQLYASFGVRQLWVIDTATRLTSVHRRPDAEGRWGSIEDVPATAELAAEALPVIKIKLASLD